MKPEIDVRWDSTELRANLNEVERKQLPFAMALTLTRIGKQVREAQVAEMRQVFDRPTPFTLRALFTKPANKRDGLARMQSVVWFKDRFAATKSEAGGEFLLPHVYGGARKPKRSEKLLRIRGLLRAGDFIVPAAGAQIDAYGNPSRGQMQRILSDLGAQRDATANATERSRKRRSKARVGEYFFGRPDASNGAIGIFQRVQFAFGSGVRPVYIVTKPPQYRKRFAFFTIAETIAAREYDVAFKAALTEALQSAKR